MSLIEETNKIIESAGDIIEQHTIKAEALVKGKTYKAARDILFAELDDVDYLEPDDLKKFKAKGYIKGKNIVFPKGTPIKFVGNFGGAYAFNVAGVEIDMLLDDNMLESTKNEDNASELKKELEYLYRGIGWAEWDYFKEGLATTNFKPNGMSDKDLEKMINASGIAKVKKVRDIKKYQDMQDFDPKDFRPDDKIIVTKKPMSSKFFGEALKKNEDWDGDMNKAIEEGCKAYLKAYLEVCKKHNAAVYAPHFEQNAAMQAGIGLKDNFILPILRRLCKSYPTYKSAKEMPTAIKKDAIEQIGDYLNVDNATAKLLDDCQNCWAEPDMSNIIDSCIKNSGSFIKL